MTHDELLAKIDYLHYRQVTPAVKALRAIVELCKAYLDDIDVSGFAEGIIETIEKELG